MEIFQKKRWGNNVWRESLAGLQFYQLLLVRFTNSTSINLKLLNLWESVACTRKNTSHYFQQCIGKSHVFGGPIRRWFRSQKDPRDLQSIILQRRPYY